MSETSSEILIYVPLGLETLTEFDQKWIENFESILNLNLKQILKKDFKVFKLFNEPDKIDKSNITIQLLLNNSIEEDKVLKSEHLKEQYIINLYCDPTRGISDQAKSENAKNLIFYDESSLKRIDLTQSLQSLKSNIWLKFLDISYEIRKVFLKTKISTKNIGSIYLAETTDDQSHYRDVLKRELEHLGYKMLPESKLSDNLIEFTEQVQNDLNESFLSIHIIGNNYESLNKNIEVSAIELQNDLFNEVMSQNAKPIFRFVWLPPDIKPKTEKQRQYIESFKRNIELLKSTEIIQAPIEVFKTIIKKKTEELLSIKKINSEQEIEKHIKSVYLMYNDKDNKLINEAKSYIRNQGFNLLETTLNGNKVEQIKEHYSNLVKADSVMIFYTINNDQWLNSKLSDLLKAPGFGKRNKFTYKSIIYNTVNSPKMYLRIPDMELIDMKNGKIEDKMKSFTEKIK